MKNSVVMVEELSDRPNGGRGSTIMDVFECRGENKGKKNIRIPRKADRCKRLLFLCPCIMVANIKGKKEREREREKKNGRIIIFEEPSASSSSVMMKSFVGELGPPGRGRLL